MTDSFFVPLEYLASRKEYESPRDYLKRHPFQQQQQSADAGDQGMWFVGLSAENVPASANQDQQQSAQVSPRAAVSDRQQYSSPSPPYQPHADVPHPTEESSLLRPVEREQSVSPRESVKLVTPPGGMIEGERIPSPVELDPRVSQPTTVNPQRVEEQQQQPRRSGLETSSYQEPLVLPKPPENVENSNQPRVPVTTSHPPRHDRSKSYEILLDGNKVGSTDRIPPHSAGAKRPSQYTNEQTLTVDEVLQRQTSLGRSQHLSGSRSQQQGQTLSGSYSMMNLASNDAYNQDQPKLTSSFSLSNLDNVEDSEMFKAKTNEASVSRSQSLQKLRKLSQLTGESVSSQGSIPDALKNEKSGSMASIPDNIRGESSQRHQLEDLRESLEADSKPAVKDIRPSEFGTEGRRNQDFHGTSAEIPKVGHDFNQGEYEEPSSARVAWEERPPAAVR